MQVRAKREGSKSRKAEQECHVFRATQRIYQLSGFDLEKKRVSGSIVLGMQVVPQISQDYGTWLDSLIGRIVGGENDKSSGLSETPCRRCSRGTLHDPVRGAAQDSSSPVQFLSNASNARNHTVYVPEFRKTKPLLSSQLFG